MVLKGTAPLSLVDSYNEERIPIADEIIQLSSKNLNFFVSESYWFFQARKLGLALFSYLMPYLPTSSGGSTFAMVCDSILRVLHFAFFRTCLQVWSMLHFTNKKLLLPCSQI